MCSIIVKIGMYTVEVEQAGFKRERRSGLQLSIQQQLVVDFELSVGEVTTEVNVTAEAPLLQDRGTVLSAGLDPDQVNQ